MADVLREFDKKQQKNILKEELSKQQISQIRSNIERIISSYRHIWDIYAELLQNSADAIIEKFGEDKIEQGRIELEINTEQREIIITDNGIGIEESEISKILVNGKSLKREKNTGKFGFMGYGFTFVAFQSNLLKIESIKDGIKASRTYRNLYHFIYSKSELPNSEEEEIDQKSQSTSEESQTKITVKFPNDFPNEVVEETLSTAFNFAKCEKTIEAILRTRSVVGTLDKVFSSKEYFQFSLKVDGQKFKIKTGYLTVREIVREVLGIEQSFYDRLGEYENFIKLGVVAVQHGRELGGDLPAGRGHHHERDLVIRAVEDAQIAQILADPQQHLGGEGGEGHPRARACAAAARQGAAVQEALRLDGGPRCQEGGHAALGGGGVGLRRADRCGLPRQRQQGGRGVLEGLVRRPLASAVQREPRPGVTDQQHGGRRPGAGAGQRHLGRGPHQQVPRRHVAQARQTAAACVEAPQQARPEDAVHRRVVPDVDLDQAVGLALQASGHIRDIPFLSAY